MEQDGTPEEALDGEIVDETSELPANRPWPKPWMRAFLASLSLLPDISSAARTARVGRTTVYRHRDANTAFAEAWDEAWEIGHDGLERVALNWSTTGVPTKSVRTHTVTRVKKALHPEPAKRKAGELIIIEETTTTTVEETVGSERSAALLLATLRALRPEKWNPVHRFGLGQDPDAGPIRIDSLSEIDRQIAALGAELELLDRHRPVEADTPREITSGE